MAKTEISSTDLVWVFTEKLRSFGDCAPNVSIAIVPSKDGWMAIASRSDRHAYPLCAPRIEQVQKRLREIYVLANDGFRLGGMVAGEAAPARLSLAGRE